MNIAELFVRVRADVTDVDRRLKAVENSLGRVDRASKSAGLSTGRLGNQFAGLAGSIAHVHPVVGNLAGVLGQFAVGGAVTAGVLGGLALIAVAYDQLTKATREATKEQDALIKSLERSIHLKGLGPGGETVDQVGAARERAAALGTQIEKLRAMVVLDAMDADVMASNLVIQEKINKLTTERQNALNAMAGGQSIVNEKIAAAIPPILKAKEHTVALKKVVEDVAFSWREAFEWADRMANTIESITLQEAREALGVSPDLSTDISGSVDSVKEEIRTREELTHASERNAEVVRSAVLQSAQIIVGALNIGGGGRNSNLGGALGSTAGFAAGFVFGGGPVGGAIGSTIGGLLGSAIGGLFDSNTKATNANTEATRANTAALMLNAPSGYKTAGARFDATEIRTSHQRYLTRGGTPILGTT